MFGVGNSMIFGRERFEVSILSELSFGVVK
jgi:hypothetical protein